MPGTFVRYAACARVTVWRYRSTLLNYN